MKFIGRMLVSLIVGLAIIAVAGYFYISLGFAPVSTASPPLPFEKTITSMALNARIKKEAPAQAALPVTDDHLIAGARGYTKYCAVCHGLEGQPVGETYWKIENGIRLTGMPGFRQSLPENQIWQIALLLANADKLPPAAKTIVSTPVP